MDATHREQILSDFAKEGEAKVRAQYKCGHYDTSGEIKHLVTEWLDSIDKETALRRDSREEAMLAASREALDLANRANEIAANANRLAEKANATAEESKKAEQSQARTAWLALIISVLAALFAGYIAVVTSK